MSNEVRLSVRIPKKLYKKLLSASNEVGNPMSSIVRVALTNYFKEK